MWEDSLQECSRIDSNLGNMHSSSRDEKKREKRVTLSLCLPFYRWGFERGLVRGKRSNALQAVGSSTRGTNPTLHSRTSAKGLGRRSLNHSMIDTCPRSDISYQSTDTAHARAPTTVRQPGNDWHVAPRPGATFRKNTEGAPTLGQRHLEALKITID